MANSEIQKRIEAAIDQACDASDFDVNVLADAMGGSNVDGLHSPSSGSDVSLETDCARVPLLDPSVGIRVMIDSGATASEAIRVLEKYYSAVGASSGSWTKSLSSGSGTSNKKKRVQSWANEIAEISGRPGFCYLHIIRYSRRSCYARALGPCPMLKDLVFMLEPFDLDVVAARQCSVYRLDNVGGSTAVRYYIGQLGEDSQRVGSVHGVVSCMLRLYPSLNARDLALEVDLTVSTIPLVGQVVLSYGSEVGLGDDSLPLNVSSSFEQCSPVKALSLDTESVSNTSDIVSSLNGIAVNLFGVDASYEVKQFEAGETVMLVAPPDKILLGFFDSDVVAADDIYGDLEPVYSLKSQVFVKSYELGKTSSILSVQKASACFVLYVNSKQCSYAWLLEQLRDTGWLHSAAVQYSSELVRFSGYSELQPRDSVDRYGMLKLFRELGSVYYVPPLERFVVPEIQHASSLPVAAVVDAERYRCTMQLAVKFVLESEPGVLSLLDHDVRSDLCSRLMSVLTGYSPVFGLRNVDGFVFADQVDRSLVSVSVQSFEAGKQLAMLHPKTGTDIWLFRSGSVVLDHGLWNDYDMMPMSNREPSAVIKHGGLEGEDLLLLTTMDAFVVKIHVDGYRDGLPLLREIICDSGWMHVTAFDCSSNADDFYYSYRRSRPGLHSSCKGLAAVMAEAAELCFVSRIQEVDYDCDYEFGSWVPGSHSSTGF